MRPRRSLPLLLLAASACTNSDSVRPDPSTSGSSAGAAGASTLTAGAAGAYTAPPPDAKCPSGLGPKMVPIVLPGVTAFCIDTTEVTQKQYVEFLSEKCAWMG